MSRVRRPNFTVESVTEIAKQFSSRFDFQKGDKAAYNWALKNGCLDAACSGMEWRGNISRNLEDVAASALRFKSRTAFERGANADYTWAKRNGHFDAVCRHMEWDGNVSWTIESATEMAKNFSSRRAFDRGGKGAYAWSCANGVLDVVCEHMGRARGGFDRTRPGYLYFMRFTGPLDQRVFKVGITNRGALERIKRAGIRPGWSIELQAEFLFTVGAHANEEEDALLYELEDHAYSGPRFLENGYTELFNVDVYAHWRASHQLGGAP